jgi:hypothetical protein
MAGIGPLPKPAHLRQRTNKKAGNAMIQAVDSPEIPELPAHPDGRTWHAYTVESWCRAWGSAMASQWLPTEFDGVFRLAMKWDDYYLKGRASDLGEIRLQEQRFGLSPLDRSRLQWEVNRGDEATRKLRQRIQPSARVSGDPRKLLTAVK